MTPDNFSHRASAPGLVAITLALLTSAVGCGDDTVTAPSPDVVTADTLVPSDDTAELDTLGDTTGAEDVPVADTLPPSDTEVGSDTTPFDPCAKGCGAHASCVDQACRCDAGWHGDGFLCEDDDECAEGTAFCGEGATCGNLPGSWTCTCPDGSEGQAISCDLTSCGCPWDTTGCRIRTAALEVIVLDLWARPVTGDTVTVTSAAGDTVPFGAGGLAPLCGSDTFTLTARANDHHAVTQQLTWYGPTAGQPLVATGAMPEGGATVVTQSERVVEGATVDVVTVWVGLPHRWFAASARPWHAHTPLELFTSGETAWIRTAQDITAATQLITISTWWWRSNFELLRLTPSQSVNLSSSDRWLNTLMSKLNGTSAKKKVLVNQFLSQDGLLSNVNVDDDLLAKGEAKNDGFDFMGHANDASGEFTIHPRDPDFGAALAASVPAAAAATWVHENPAEAYIGATPVDMTELPLGLSLFDIPLASWHQKFMTLDQKIAYIGGMNFNLADWDTDAHLVFDPRRMPFDASTSERRDVLDKESEPDNAPRTDYLSRFTGPAVRDAVDVFHRRWAHQLAAGVRFAGNNTPFDLTDATAAPATGGVELQVVATMPEPFAEYGILETLLRAISQAEHYIFIQDQYFRAPLLGDAIADRMSEVPDLQLIVLTNAMGEWSDPGCWQSYLENEVFESQFPNRFGLFKLQSFDYVRTDCTFCWDETEAHFVEHDLHAKMVMIDDVYLEVGSANHNNRGLVYEGELAIAVHDAAWVEQQRHRIFGNLIGPAYTPTTTMGGLLSAFRAAASKNQAAYDKWDDEGMDLDLDGKALPTSYQPSGFVYPLDFRDPHKCFIEGVGADVT